MGVRRTRLAVEVCNTINGGIAALCCVEGGAADAESAFLEGRGTGETGEEGEKNCWELHFDVTW